MLSNIVSIGNADVLGGFSGAAAQLPDFKAKNLIYGWNASGKTTLSRLFGQLERGASRPCVCQQWRHGCWPQVHI